MLRRSVEEIVEHCRSGGHASCRAKTAASRNTNSVVKAIHTEEMLITKARTRMPTTRMTGRI